MGGGPTNQNGIALALTHSLFYPSLVLGFSTGRTQGPGSGSFPNWGTQSQLVTTPKRDSEKGLGARVRSTWVGLKITEQGANRWL